MRVLVHVGKHVVFRALCILEMICASKVCLRLKVVNPARLQKGYNKMVKVSPLWALHGTTALSKA